MRFHPLPRYAALLLSTLLLLSCGRAALYRLSPAPAAVSQTRLGASEQFVLISDTQYAVPFTDYDVRYQPGKQVVNLPPSLTTHWSNSFYRHAEAHLAVPLALSSILAQEEKSKNFGLFGGDMAEFSCNAETKRMFNVFRAHPKIPFIVAIGNHDATFHGSYDTDAIAESGQGPWDTYSFALWQYVCAPHGGPLTKTGFIRQLLDYYHDAWGFDFKQALKLANAADDYPLGQQLSGTVSKSGWTLDFSLRLGPPNDPSSHRQSYFYQRWSHRPADEQPATLTVTVLDTMDLGSRKVLCDPYGQVIQVGLAGAISSNQLDWLQARPKVTGPHFVLSHHVPFEDIVQADGTRLDSCETTLGTRCLGASLLNYLGPVTFLYAHVHRTFEQESLISIENENTCKIEAETRGTSCADDDPKCKGIRMIRLPSLIDNKSYGVYEDQNFSERGLDSAPIDRTKTKTPALPSGKLESLPPLTLTRDTCEQRYLELVELHRNVDCFTGSRCEPLYPLLQAQLPNAKALCQGEAAVWKSANAPLWNAFKSECTNDTWAGADPWRCILERWGAKVVADANLDDNAQFSTELLAAACPLSGRTDDCTVATNPDAAKPTAAKATARRVTQQVAGLK